MENLELYAETKKYIERFYEPELSAYDFLKVFFAELYLNGIKDVSRDLVDFFYEMKKQVRFNEILREIKFKSNGVFLYSNDLEDNIFTLQNMGLLGKENPSFGKILIKYSDSVCSEIIESVSEKYVALIKEIVNVFMQSQD